MGVVVTIMAVIMVFVVTVAVRWKRGGSSVSVSGCGGSTSMGGSRSSGVSKRKCYSLLMML